MSITQSLIQSIQLSIFLLSSSHPPFFSLLLVFFFTNSTSLFFLFPLHTQSNLYSPSSFCLTFLFLPTLFNSFQPPIRYFSPPLLIFFSQYLHSLSICLFLHFSALLFSTFSFFVPFSLPFMSLLDSSFFIPTNNFPLRSHIPIQLLWLCFSPLSSFFYFFFFLLPFLSGFSFFPLIFFSSPPLSHHTHHILNYTYTPLFSSISSCKKQLFHFHLKHNTPAIYC